MHQGLPTTKVLFLDNDETSFNFRKCMARVLTELPPVELFHANDASEALTMIEQLKPDVIVVDEEIKEELQFFFESLAANHPPIVLQTDFDRASANVTGKQVTCIRKNESLAGIHQTLMIVATIAAKASKIQNAMVYH